MLVKTTFGILDGRSFTSELRGGSGASLNANGSTGLTLRSAKNAWGALAVGSRRGWKIPIQAAFIANPFYDRNRMADQMTNRNAHRNAGQKEDNRIQGKSFYRPVAARILFDRPLVIAVIILLDCL
jgi:hypothetical protein